MLSSKLRLFILPTINTIIFLWILTTTGLINSSMAVASPSSAATVPPGYSSEVIQIKFREGTGLHPLDAPFPPNLNSSIANINPLFSLSEERLDKLRLNQTTRSTQKLPNLNMWFQVTLKPGTDANNFMENLKRLDSVEIVEPAPLPAPPSAITPNFTTNQGFLNAAANGIDALFSWITPGGNGSGVTIYDVEYSWNQTHEDLSKANGVPFLLNPGDSAIDPFNDDNHGTAVLGELVADNNTKGVTGISWGADIRLVPAYTAKLHYNPANAILLAVSDASAGDVILIEQQYPVCGLPDYGPAEWLNSVFDVIRTATAHGIVVVEAAGNGGVNLDQPACGSRFDRTLRDSGAIIVGAGGPPTSSLDRQRLTFSSYGSRVDLQGWGQGVMTTGYGLFYSNPDTPTNRDFWYTATFSGTSSASPIVAGAVANLQGIAKKRGLLLTPTQIRTTLVQTGSPQLGNTTQHIGPRPNLRQAIAEQFSTIYLPVISRIYLYRN